MKIVRRSEETILQFIETVKDKYPHLTQQELIAICRSSFKLIASEMKKGDLNSVRVKYLGNFTVYPGRVKGLFNKAVKFHEKGKMSEETFKRYKEITDNYYGKNSLD